MNRPSPHSSFPTAPPRTRTPDPLIKSLLRQNANPLKTQALTNNTESVLPDSLPDSVQNDPDLTAVVTAWPELPEPIRVAILTMVTAVAAAKPTPRPRERT